jgi:hypothetical protein
MRRTRPARLLASAATVALATLVAAGCGQQGGPGAAAGQPLAVRAAGTTSVTTTSDTTPTASTGAPGTSAAASATPPAPVTPTALVQPTTVLPVTVLPTTVRATPPSTTTASPTGIDGKTSGSPAHPYFSTPQAAMRYLATAWNTDNLTDLKHVTDPGARSQLLGMKRQAVNLRLRSCEKREGGNGDYLCDFTHDYPSWVPAADREGAHGSAEFIAAPSAGVGWYMTLYIGCG